ncbi:MAG: putative DNA binding domain-containing protein [Phaeodactylibacter sp.]|nr:putative DNA binding domain-containing protein [Phaeodactylibacter sp.]
MIETREITAEQLKMILSYDEDHYKDLKSKRIAPGKLTRSLSAFANAEGGELFIGIEEVKQGDGVKKRVWDGFTDVEEANGHIQAFEELFPLSDEFSYTFLSVPTETGLVLQIGILKTREIKNASNGTPYKRRGAQNLPVNTSEGLERLKLDKGIISFEDNTVNAPEEIISDSLKIFEFLIQVIPTTEPRPWLKKQLLLHQGKPIVAGVLLFADEPQAALPKRSAIKIYRYVTNKEATRETLAFQPLTIEGPIYDMIYEAVEKVKEIIENISILTPEGMETTNYPEETLHEIITNAVLHRDYSIASDIHIRIFDNRVEIESPGKLPGHITVKNILNEQAARNGKLVRLVNKFPNPPNKDVGEGLNTAFDAMKNLRLKPPIIEETENSVLVIIKHERLASPEDIVMDYLESHEEIKNSIARELTGIQSENSMKDVFKRLQKRELIEKVPGKRGPASAWRKCSTAANKAHDDHAS